MSWLVDIELSDDGAVGPMMAELVSFERRFGRYVAAVGTNKLLGRFLDEIGVAQRLIQTGSSELSEHFTRMQSTIAEIQSKMAQAEPVYQSEARFEALALALSRFRRGISNPDGPSQARIDGLLADLTSRWQSVQRSQSLLVQGGMDKSSHPLNETVDAQLQEVPHILERCYSARASITEEMRVIHARLAAIQAERRLPDADLSQLDTEFQDLNGNLNRLIERLSELP
jgi:DNA repair exonuclease SbcCD ATPase subunit